MWDTSTVPTNNRTRIPCFRGKTCVFTSSFLCRFRLPPSSTPRRCIEPCLLPLFLSSSLATPTTKVSSSSSSTANPTTTYLPLLLPLPPPPLKSLSLSAAAPTTTKKVLLLCPPPIRSLSLSASFFYSKLPLHFTRSNYKPVILQTIKIIYY